MLNFFADTMLVSTNSNATADSPASLIVGLIVGVLLLVSYWKIFEKAGEKGWKALIPIYDTCILFKIAGHEMWKVLLILVPFVNIYILFKVNIDLAHKFGKSTAFGVLAVFFSGICYPILAFGDAKYNGKASKKA